VEVEDIVREIGELADEINTIEQQITYQTEILKELFVKSSSAMKESQNLLTCKGIEVVGEEVIPIPEFIENVVRFANYPNKKIEVLKELATHLQKINQMVAGDISPPEV
jgi:Na+/phosphate symporter